MVELQASKSAGAARTKSNSSTAAAMKVKSKPVVNKAVPEKKKKKKKQTAEPPPESPSYRLALKSIFSCRNSHGHPSDSNSSRQCNNNKKKQVGSGCSSAPSICKLQVNNKQDSCDRSTTEKPAKDDEEEGEGTANKRRASVSGSSERCVKKPQQLSGGEVSSNNNKKKLQRGGGSWSSSSFRAGMQLRRLSGCYECHMVVDPVFRDSSSSMRAASICPCPECGEIFVRQESLQLHQSIRHAVSELGSEDTSRNIIEIIFQSSWLKKQSPVCRIERILKVHNSPRTLARFEEYRDAVKAKANKKKHPRCTADGNELLRFHCAALGCSLGIHGATHLCGACATCAVIRDGFVVHAAAAGIRTMATSGRAHDAAALTMSTEEERSMAMLVCRVIAGRVKRPSRWPGRLGYTPTWRSFRSSTPGPSYHASLSSLSLASEALDRLAKAHSIGSPCYIMYTTRQTFHA